MVVSQIAEWGRRKGIDLLGTADWTHPLWFKELKAGLEEVGEGIYRAKGTTHPYFLLSTEISSIYSQGGKLRKIHNLVLASSFEIVEKINSALLSKGCNLMADGRPIIGITSRDLTAMILEIDENCLVIPAHIWTPWFSLFGANSGFDSLKECFGDMSKFIYAIETGLSSDPAMNWRIEQLDNRSILSFSDAHSPEKLAREATVFEIGEEKKLSYDDVKRAIQEQKVEYTIEFYPEEGKYHYTGHRNCGVRQSPEETRKLGSICPVCGKKLTVGVMHRVEQLASRASDFKPSNRPSYKMLVPLMEILAESFQTGVTSQKVYIEYNKLIESFGSEFNVLIQIKPEEIGRVSGEKVAEAIKKVRKGELLIEPGYDGLFGKVKIWAQPASDSEAPRNKQKQMTLF
jgi:uncharacterized protein (TIGR00375 family)